MKKYLKENLKIIQYFNVKPGDFLPILLHITWND